jgi:hypothetical protein
MLPWMLVLGLLAAGSPSASGAIEGIGGQRTLPSTTVVINEVEYDTLQSGTDSASEWFELYNLTSSPISVTGWTIVDNTATDVIPTLTLPANGFCIVAGTTAGFLTYYPSYTGCLVQVADGIIGSGLANGADTLTLRDNVATAIDGMNWGANTTNFNCTGFPCATATGPGKSLEREPLGQDTDTAADWVLRFAPSPGGQGINVTATPSNTPTTAPPTNTPTLTFTPTAGPTATPTNTATPGGTHLVINEFSARSSPEWIEVLNPTGATVSLVGWSLRTDFGLLTAPLTGTLPAGGFLTIDVTTADLDDEGDIIRLKDNANADVDVVGYGFRGGAPMSLASASSGRVLDGVDTDDNAADFNFATTATKGTANAGSIPGVNLGSSVKLNELDTFVPLVTDPDKVEIYNPSGAPVNLAGWRLSDGDAIAPLTGTLTVPAMGWLVLTENVNWTITMDYGSTDVAYLLDNNGVRVDQLGYNGVFEDATTCYQRVPDGAGPNTGYNYTSSGGGSTLFVLACTLGATNGNATPTPTNTATSVPPTETPTPGASATPSPTNTSLPGATSVVINEFNAKNSPEWIELYNPTGAAVDLSGYRLTTDVGQTGVLSYTFPSGTILSAGAFLSVNVSPAALDNSGDIIRLKNVANADVDVVGYGSRGGAPLPPFDFSTGRIVDGLDTNDHALDWNQAGTMTQGGPNNVPLQALGLGVFINELDGSNTTGGAEPDRLEVYNPGCTDLDVFNWKISDGDAMGVVSHTVMIPAGGWAVLLPNVDYTTTSFGPDFTGSDVAYLFDDGGTRVDQIGWSGGPSESGAATRQRTPDGSGVSTGYDYASSGGGTTWVVQAATLGTTNIARTLGIAKSGNNAVLSWSASPGATGYNVYRGTTPYFTPTICTPYATTTTTTYTDVGAIGNPATNYYYVVTAMTAQGEVRYGNRVGEFDYALTAGPVGDTALNDIAIPLDVSGSGITDAESLALWIESEGGVAFGTVRQLLKWNASLQNFEAWSHEFTFGDNFVLNPGDYVFLTVDQNAPATASLVGGVPDPGDVSFALAPGTASDCALNFLSLPFDQAQLTTADLLSDDIGTPDVTVVQALDWDAPIQNFLAWANVFGFGDNFPTTIGHPYIVCLDNTAPVSWP